MALSMKIISPKLPVICLMGPTASGKTPLAIKLVQEFPMEIISVDSAMVYRDMNIGTAKPESAVLKVAPHRLIDIRDPAEAYSAGEFQRDVLKEIAEIHAKGKTPLLVGGTMLYFRVLREGLAELPNANEDVRKQLTAEGERLGWEVLHHRLSEVDPVAANRIHSNDSQRIQRALEVFMLSGQSLTDWQKAQASTSLPYHIYNFALAPQDRKILHERIYQRFHLMLEQGFIAEVEKLMARGDLSLDTPSMRSVGYRQAWEHLLGEYDHAVLCDKAIAATRQLAKRQLTWLRSWPELTWLDSEEEGLLDKFKNINI